MAHKPFMLVLGGFAALGLATTLLSYARTRTRERRARTTARMRRVRANTRLRTPRVTPQQAPNGSLVVGREERER